MIKEWTKRILLYFCMITTGIVISAFLSCLLFAPGATFTVSFLGQILLLSLLIALMPLIQLILKPTGEISKKHWIRRQLIFMIAIIIVVLIFAFHFGWVSRTNCINVVFVSVCVIGVYWLIQFLLYQNDKKEAAKMLKKIKMYQEKGKKNQL